MTTAPSTFVIPAVTLRQVFLILLSTYIALSFTFWTPWTPPTSVNLFKEILVVTLYGLAIAALAFKSTTTLPLHPIGLGALPITIVAASPGLIQTTSDGFVWIFREYLLIFTFLSFGYIAVCLKIDFRRHLAPLIYGVAFIVLLCILTVLSGVSGEANLGGTFVTAALGGFGGSRTTWSDALGFYGAAASMMFLNRFAGRRAIVLAAISLTLIFASQVMVGGRGGMMASVLATPFCILALGVNGPLKDQRRLFAMMAVGAVVLAVSWPFVSDVLRLEHKGGAYISTLDQVSSGRIQTYVQAANLIAERPLSGYGFDDWQKLGTFVGHEVHNTWLEYWYQAGVVYLLWMIVFTVGIMVVALAMDRSASARGSLPLSPIIVAGVIQTFVEPNMLIGSFQISSIWWVVAGVVIAERDLRIYAPKKGRELPAPA